MIDVLVFSYFLIFFFFAITLVLLWIKDSSELASTNDHTPFISILLAARNEEKNIINCLENLGKLNYSSDRYEVLIGNDQSEDETETLIENFIKDKSNFKLLNIKENLGMAKGKANVLAHLAKQAKGEYFFITD